MSYGGIMRSKAKGQITFHTPVESWQRDRKNPPSCHLGFTKILTTLESPVVFSQVRHHNHPNGRNALWQGLWLTPYSWGFFSVVQIPGSFPSCACIFCPQLVTMKWFDSLLTMISLSYLYNFCMHICFTQCCGRAVIELGVSSLLEGNSPGPALWLLVSWLFFFSSGLQHH